MAAVCERRADRKLTAMLRFGLALIVATIATLLIAPSASAAPPAFSPDGVIVEWAAGASSMERRAARDEADVDFARDLGSRRFQLVEGKPGQTSREAIRELEEDPAVVLAERDGYFREGLDPQRSPLQSALGAPEHRAGHRWLHRRRRE